MTTTTTAIEAVKKMMMANISILDRGIIILVLKYTKVMGASGIDQEWIFDLQPIALRVCLSFCLFVYLRV